MNLSLPNGRKLPDGTVLIFYVKLSGSPKTWTYVALKEGGRWFMTGQGSKVPREAGWGVIEKWVGDPDREVLSIEKVADTYPVLVNPIIQKADLEGAK